MEVVKCDKLMFKAGAEETGVVGEVGGETGGCGMVKDASGGAFGSVDREAAPAAIEENLFELYA